MTSNDLQIFGVKGRKFVKVRRGATLLVAAALVMAASGCGTRWTDEQDAAVDAMLAGGGSDGVGGGSSGSGSATGSGGSLGSGAATSSGSAATSSCLLYTSPSPRDS